MQEIEYFDGEKSKDLFSSLTEALDDAKEKNKRKPIKSLKVTCFIPSRKRRRK